MMCRSSTTNLYYVY